MNVNGCLAVRTCVRVSFLDVFRVRCCFNFHISIPGFSFLLIKFHFVFVVCYLIIYIYYSYICIMLFITCCCCCCYIHTCNMFLYVYIVSYILLHVYVCETSFFFRVHFFCSILMLAVLLLLHYFEKKRIRWRKFMSQTKHYNNTIHIPQ